MLAENAGCLLEFPRELRQRRHCQKAIRALRRGDLQSSRAHLASLGPEPCMGSVPTRELAGELVLGGLREEALDLLRLTRRRAPSDSTLARFEQAVERLE